MRDLSQLASYQQRALHFSQTLESIRVSCYTTLNETTHSCLRCTIRYFTSRVSTNCQSLLWKHRALPGDAREICQQIVDRLWYGDFYRTSLGHYNFFWMRDFGTVADSLVRLNHATRVHHTLRWAMRHYRRGGRIKLCIDKNGNVFNAPGLPSIDALPWLLHSFVVSHYSLNADERPS